jgi:hypothetical protein
MAFRNYDLRDSKRQFLVKFVAFSGLRELPGPFSRSCTINQIGNFLANRCVSGSDKGKQDYWNQAKHQKHG